MATAARRAGGVGPIALGYGLMLALGLVDNARGPAFPRILDDLTLSDTHGSLLFASASFGSVVVSVTGYWWLDRLGVFGAARAFGFLLGLGCLGIGLVGLLPAGLGGLVAASLLFGFAATGCSVTGNAIVGGFAPEAGRRRYLSGLHAMYGVSSLLSPVALITAARFGFGWPALFVGLGAVPAAVGVAALLIRRRPVPRRTIDVAGPTRTPPRPAVAWSCLLLALYVVAELAISTRLPLLGVRHHGLGDEAAALYLSVFFALLLAGRVVFAVVRLPGRDVTWLALSAGTSLVADLVGLFVHPAGLALCGLTMSVFFPTAIALFNERFGAAADRVVASSIAAVGVGLVLMQLGVGALTDLVGIRDALLVGPVCLVGVLALLAVPGWRGGRAQGR